MNEAFVREQTLIDQYVGNQLWSWGHNGYGEVGDNTVVHKSSPVQTVSGGTNWKDVASGTYHSAAIKTDGTLWLWGYNHRGQLGDNSITNRSSPVQTVLTGSNWWKISMGLNFSSALKTNGTLWCWGDNTNGACGRNDRVHRSSPVQEILGGTTWIEVSAGLAVSVGGLKSDGTIWLWGNNTYGQLGKNDVVHRSSPVQELTGSTNWKTLSVNYHTVALKTDGTLWSWGINSSGTLGDNTNSIHRSSPVQEITGSTNWKKVHAGNSRTGAIKDDGTLWMWGANANGQLGDNTSISKSSPVQTICGGTNWKDVLGNSGCTVAIKTDGSLWLWGHNHVGQLGDGTSALHRSSPVQTLAGGTNWKKVDVGFVATALTYTE
jgi:alpha-tubulin suppressor-like RCC1 family protein